MKAARLDKNGSITRVEQIEALRIAIRGNSPIPKLNDHIFSIRSKLKNGRLEGDWVYIPDDAFLNASE